MIASASTPNIAYVGLVIAVWVAAGAARGVGCRASTLIVPILIANFGVRSAIPLYAIAYVFLSTWRTWPTRHQVDRRALRTFGIAAFPPVIVAAAALAALPPSLLVRIIGLALIVTTRSRHLVLEDLPTLSPAKFAALSAGGSFMSALVGVVPPLPSPFVAAFQVPENARASTISASEAMTSLTAIGAYAAFALVTPRLVLLGTALAVVMATGAAAGSRVLAVRTNVVGFLTDLTVLALGIILLVEP